MTSGQLRSEYYDVAFLVALEAARRLTVRARFPFCLDEQPRAVVLVHERRLSATTSTNAKPQQQLRVRGTEADGAQPLVRQLHSLSMLLTGMNLADIVSCRRLLRRAPAQAPSYASTAILCGDSTDEHGTTMTDVFNSIIAASRNVSHLCAFYHCTLAHADCAARLAIITPLQSRPPGHLCRISACTGPSAPSSDTRAHSTRHLLTRC